MCLVLIGWRAHPDYRLIVAANRDEFYSRPTESMRAWPEVPGLIAGRDTGAAGRAAGEPPGTWLGLVTQPQDNGRFGTVTNVRNRNARVIDGRSRGALLMDFLHTDPDHPSSERPAPEEYTHDIATGRDDYDGYNLVVSDLRTLWWHSNRSAGMPQQLAAGFHGVSNSAFVTSARPIDTDLELSAPQPIWPKVRTGLTELNAVVRSDPEALDRYFSVLTDRTETLDQQAPPTGLPLDLERALSARFVAHSLYGTRASTVLLVREDGTFDLVERSFGTLGQELGTVARQGRLDLAR
ncbi:NRDE family protein [Nocardia sp. CNY236]|uniref:NRDE family protein n=1 Tax=Nocardia sp. CNY236 TaxID=1169152 RepID=UPI00048E3CD9|nr:NRDE family protein [Nocardia sp. CNY236]